MTKARCVLSRARRESQMTRGCNTRSSLVLIRQHGHQEAVELLDTDHRPGARRLHLWRAKIWVEMAMHKDREALTDVRAVADFWPNKLRRHCRRPRPKAWRTTAEFLARVFGFLEVPRPVPCRPKICAAPSNTCWPAGRRASGIQPERRAVAERFQRLCAASEDLRAQSAWRKE